MSQSNQALIFSPSNPIAYLYIPLLQAPSCTQTAQQFLAVIPPQRTEVRAEDLMELRDCLISILETIAPHTVELNQVAFLIESLRAFKLYSGDAVLAEHRNTISTIIEQVVNLLANANIIKISSDAITVTQSTISS